MTGPVVIDVVGHELIAADHKRLAHPLVGMVILFAKNFRSATQLIELTNELHALHNPPLLVAVDHEGGRVQRFREPPFTRIPPMAALGRLWDGDVLLACKTALSAGFVIGAELRAHGVDLSFTPVLDIDWGPSSVIGDRALHADPRTVAMLASHLNHGLALAGMANCGKHFPGHGWAAADSHVAIPVDERPLNEIVAADAAPFGWLGAGLAGVMPAHVVYPKVDPLPAGFSRFWLQDVLRGRLGFTGAIFSDDLSMEGARVAGGVAESAQAALDAGCDYVLICGAPEAADEVLAKLRWTPTEEFARHVACIAPRGRALTPEQLAADPTYLAARADVERLAEGSAA
ncbi:MAG: beta-N-acetylhexosaminidase [Betaproteobacteria bacterium]